MSEKYPTLGEAKLEIEGLVMAEVSALKKTNQDVDKEMADWLDKSMTVIKFHCD